MPSFSDFAGYEGFLFGSGGVKTRCRPTALARNRPPLLPSHLALVSQPKTVRWIRSADKLKDQP